MLKNFLEELNDYIDSLAIYGLNIIKSEDIEKLTELIKVGNKLNLDNLVNELDKLKNIMYKKIHSTKKVNDDLYNQYIIVNSFLYIELSCL